jgi:hypothetical protein
MYPSIRWSPFYFMRAAEGNISFLAIHKPSKFKPFGGLTLWTVITSSFRTLELQGSTFI